MCRRNRLALLFKNNFFLFYLSLSDWVAAMTWALQSRDLRLRAEGGEEGRRGQWRSTPEAFLLLLKTERPSRPFWKTWMSLIQIQLPCSSDTDGIHSFLHQTFSGRTKREFWWDSIHSRLPLDVGSMHDVDVIWPWTCPPSARSCICPIPSHWGQWSGEVGPTPGGSGMKGMQAERCGIWAVTTPKTQTHHVWTERGM